MSCGHRDSPKFQFLRRILDKARKRHEVEERAESLLEQMLLCEYVTSFCTEGFSHDELWSTYLFESPLLNVTLRDYCKSHDSGGWGFDAWERRLVRGLSRSRLSFSFERASFAFVAREGTWHRSLVRRSGEVAAGDKRVQTIVGEDVP